MFKDVRARRAWRLYFLKAEAVLSPLATPVRRELIEDLKAHVQDILAHEQIEGDELARLNTAFARVGEPKEFLSPLLADAVFRAPPQAGSIDLAVRTLALYAARGTSYLWRAAGHVIAASFGIAIALAALNSLLRPANAGLFFTAPDTYQLRILGLTPATGDQLLTPLAAVATIAVGFAICVLVLRGVRRMLMELVAGS